MSMTTINVSNTPRHSDVSNYLHRIRSGAFLLFNDENPLYVFSIIMILWKILIHFIYNFVFNSTAKYSSFNSIMMFRIKNLANESTQY